jgi:hypothetical protein
MALAISPFSFDTKLVLSTPNSRSALFTDDPVETDATRVRITYMNEGAANVIWRIEAVGKAHSSSILLSITLMFLQTPRKSALDIDHSSKANSSA